MSIQIDEKLLERYSKELKTELENLQNCQRKSNQTSCFTCKELFDCEIRKKYVKTVYASMSHGQSGGFEF